MTDRRYQRISAISACTLAALLVLGSPAGADPKLPIEIRAGGGNAWAFVLSPDMGTCTSARLMTCYRFADGTVVAQVSLLAPLSHLLAFAGAPLGGCTEVPSMGSSLEVVGIAAGSGDLLVAGPGPCSELRRQLSGGTAYLILPGVEQPIPPTRAWVADLASFAAPTPPLPP